MRKISNGHGTDTGSVNFKVESLNITCRYIGNLFIFCETALELTLCHGNTTIVVCMPVMDNIETFDLSYMHVHAYMLP